MFNEPGGVDFDAMLAAVDGVAFVFGGFCVRFVEVDIFKEGAVAYGETIDYFSGT